MYHILDAESENLIVFYVLWKVMIRRIYAYDNAYVGGRGHAIGI